jgi:hypothetical protein
MKTKIALITTAILLLCNVSNAQKGISLSISNGRYVQDGYRPHSQNFFTSQSHGYIYGIGINYGFNDKIGLITGINDIECIMISVYHGNEGFDHMYPQYSMKQVPLNFYYLQRLKNSDNLFFRYRAGLTYNFGSTVNKSHTTTIKDTVKTFDGSIKFTGGIGCNLGISVGYEFKRWGMIELGTNLFYSPNYRRDILLKHTTVYTDNSQPTEIKSSSFSSKGGSFNPSFSFTYTLNLNNLKKR